MSRCLFLGIWTFVAVESLAGAFVGINGGFEDDAAASSWCVPAPDWRMVDGAGVSGSRALAWSNAGAHHEGFAHCPLKPEPGAVYRYGAKVKVCGLTNGVVNVSLDWTDADGRWNTSHARVLADNDPNSNGWVKFEGVTVPMPPNVAKGNILAFFEQGVTGAVLFDDFYVERMTVKTLSYLGSSAYRESVSDADGSVRIVAGLNVNTNRTSLRQLDVMLTYESRCGGKKSVKPGWLTPESAEFSVPVRDVACGANELTVDLRSSENGKRIASRQLELTCSPQAKRFHVSFDRYQRTLLDGDLFFPLGMFTSTMTDEELAIYSQGPFNFAVQYGEITTEDLDRLWRKGIRAVADMRTMIPRYDHFAKCRFQTEPECRAAVCETVKRIGRHPALIAWYLADEAPMDSSPEIAKVNGWLHALDREHPTYAVFDRPQDVRAFLSCCDVIGMDPYPVGNAGVQGGDFSLASKWPEQAANGTYRLKPMWQVPQAFSWAWFRESAASYARFPTRQELMNMAWQAIAGGANGLCWYAFHQMRRNLKGESFDRAWRDVCDVAREVKRVEGILLGEPFEWPGNKRTSDKLVVRAWLYKGRPAVLIVNRMATPVKESFPCPADWTFDKVILGRGISMSKMDLFVDFQGLGYALLALRCADGK